MNKEVSLKSDLKTFNIDVDDIELNPHLFETIQEAIDKMREETLLKNFEVVLNNNLIKAIYKPTNYKIILGCRVSYEDLEKSISFIVRPDEKPSYEYLEQQCKKQKEVIDKLIEHINKYESIKVYYEYIDEDGYDEYNYDEDFKKELLDILKEVKL